MTWIGDNSLEIAQPLRPGVGTAISLERMGEGLQLASPCKSRTSMPRAPTSRPAGPA